MQDSDLIIRAQNGDTHAYGELMELLHRKVEKFVFQCGVNVEDINGVTQEVFLNLYKSIGDFESTYFTPRLYKIALNETRSYGRREKRSEEIENEKLSETSLSTRSPQSRILVFDEDRELHEVILSLEEQHRNPLVLLYFHEIPVEQIGEILNISIEKVESRLLSSKEQLKSIFEISEEKQLETNLKLLKKSYKRVPSKFNADELLQNIISEEEDSKATQAVKKPTYSRQKLSVWAASLVFIFLIGILSASFLAQSRDNGSQKELVAEENDSEELKKSYEREKAIRREILGLTEDAFNQIEFVQMADQLFSFYFHPDKIDEHGGQSIEERYNQVIESLKLPSEMIDDVTVSRRHMQEQESMLFIDKLDMKVNQLLSYYNSLIDNHHELLNTAKMNGKLDATYLSTYRNELPQDLKSMINHAPQQGVGIQVSPDEKKYVAKFIMPDQWGMMYEYIGDPAVSLFHLKQMAPFTFGGELVYPPQDAVSMLTHLEQVLLSTNHQNSLYAVMKSHYEDLAYTLIFGTSNTKVITDGRVNEEFQFVWNNLRFNYGASPLKYFIRPVYESVSRNDWKVDETYNSLNFNDLQIAFSLAESGDLEAIMPKEDSGAITETVSWPNAEVQQKVAGYIERDDYQVISQFVGMTPIESIVLFDYAQEMGLQQINHQLLSFGNFMSDGDFETVLNSWLNDKLLSEEATSLRYEDEKTFEKFGSFVGSVDVMKGDSVLRSVPIIRNHQGLWQIDMGSNYNRYSEPVIDINEGSIQSIQDLYSRFKENYDHAILKDEGATTIAGIYLEAFTQGDLETQYELLNKGENTNVPPRDEFISSPTGEEFDWKTRFISFESIQIDDQDENQEYNVTVWLYLNQVSNSDGEYRKAFQMRKTLDGWRVHFMPFQ